MDTSLSGALTKILLSGMVFFADSPPAVLMQILIRDPCVPAIRSGRRVYGFQLHNCSLKMLDKSFEKPKKSP